MNRRLRFALVSVFVLLALALVWQWGQRSQSRTGLQRFKAELLAKGEKLTLAQLMASRGTNVNDSQAAFTNAVAKISSRLNPSTLDLRTYTAPGQIRVAWQDDSAIASVARGTSRGWERWAAEVETNQQALSELREALKNPPVDAGPLTPFPSTTFSRRVDFVAIRKAAQWLTGAAMSELHAGRLERALEDLEALAATAQMEKQEYTLIAQMIRVAVAGLGAATTWQALQAPGWTEPQLARLQSAWEQVDLIKGIETAFIGERAMNEEWWALARSPRSQSAWHMTTGGPRKPTLETLASDHVFFPLYKYFAMERDELFFLQCMQDTLEILRLLRARQPWPEAKRALDKTTARVNKLGQFQRFRFYFSSLAIPNMSAATIRAVENQTELQLTVAAIALKRYQLRYGKLPANLETLVPEFLTSVPYDPMSGRALGYRLKPDGTFVLYSAGLDGRDDGGDPSPTAGAKPGFWDGRDAVWPAPAPAAKP